MAINSECSLISDDSEVESIWLKNVLFLLNFANLGWYLSEDWGQHF